MSLEIVTGPASGTASVASDSISIDYLPEPGFFGTDSLVYLIDDGSATDTATVELTVNEVVIANSLPIAEDDTAITEQDTAANILVLANDTDPDGDPLTVTTVTAATNGIASINADGSVQYLPDVGYVGLDAFDYTIDDGVSGGATASVAIEVTGVTPVSPVAPPTASAASSVVIMAVADF